MEAVLALLRGAPGWAFALFITGGAVLASHRCSFWPGDLIPREVLPAFVVMFLVGGALLIWTGLGKLGRAVALLYRRVKASVSAIKAINSPIENFHKLTRLERDTFIWLLHHEHMRVEADLYNEPWAGLVRKGFLLRTDGDVSLQMLSVNRNALPLKEELSKQVENNPSVRKVVMSDLPPWQQRSFSGW